MLSVWADQPEEVCNCLKALRRSLFAPVARRLGWEFAATDDYLTNTLRVLAIGNAGRSNDAEIIAEAKKRFWAFVEGNKEALHPNLRGPVYNILLLTANDSSEEEKVWLKILEIYRNEALPSDQRLIALNELGSVKNPDLIRRYLNMSLDDNEIRSQDSIYVFRS